MKKTCFMIGNIPTVLWGEPSERVYLYVHGKMASKEAAEGFARIAEEKGFQTLSFDLAQHGERAGEPERCDIWNGIRDLNQAADYAFAHWKQVNLYGCSLGVCFSLYAFADRPFGRCLFQSPILDMEYLIRQMMLWFGVTETQLEQAGEVDTPVDVLSWPYYQYVLSHPVTKWEIPTSILYGGKDTMQSRETICAFVQRFGCRLTVAESSEHPFMAPEDGPIVERWSREEIQERL